MAVRTGPWPSPAGPGTTQVPPATEVVAIGAGYVLPGLVDMHCHGGGGHSVEDGADGARAAAQFHRSRGTTSMVASVVSGSRDHLLTVVTALTPLVHDGSLAGIHLEGPYLSPLRSGAHDVHNLRAPDLQEMADLLEAGTGAVRMVTLAPELPRALALVDLLVERGVVVAIGHTDATAAQCRDAVDHGAQVATHLFNGMPPLHHRQPGPVAALGADPRVACEVLHDGHHLADDTLRLAHRFLAPDRLLLVSDSCPAAGQPNGAYKLGGTPVVVSEGAVRTTDGRSLAGSVQPLAQQLAHAIEIGLDPTFAVAAATAHPAARLGLGEHVGALRPGGLANLVVTDAQWNVTRVLFQGRWQ